MRGLKAVFQYNSIYGEWPIGAQERYWISRLTRRGLAEEYNGRLKLTPAGILLAESL